MFKINVQFVTILLLLATIQFSCDTPSTTENNNDTEHEENLKYLDADDEKVAQAYEEAQKHLPEMEAYYKENTVGQYKIFVKVKFEEDGVFEHMWGSLLQTNLTQYSIRLDNEPVNIHNVAYGDVLTIEKTEVEDFLVYEGEELLLGEYMKW
jgi:uncharacterized protein YegJ (DUF2314 family)